MVATLGSALAAILVRPLPPPASARSIRALRQATEAPTTRRRRSALTLWLAMAQSHGAHPRTARNLLTRLDFGW
jgi:hypothetical protein